MSEFFKIQDELNLRLTQEARDKFVKAVKDAQDDVLSDMEYRLQEELAGWIADHVMRIYRNTVDAMLRGDQNAVLEAIGAKGYTGRENIYLTFSGELQRYGSMDLRYKIAQVNENILKDELVKDQEAQIKALEKRCKELVDRIDRMLSNE